MAKMGFIRFMSLVSLVLILTSCNDRNLVKSTQFTFAVHDNGPAKENRYRYPKVSKSAKEITSSELTWHLIDWNDNGIYNEVNIDFIGVKNTFEPFPIVEPIHKRNLISYNGIQYALDSVSQESKPIKTSYTRPIDLSYIDKYVPIKVFNGVDTMELKHDFKNYDKTVLYFWATWCRPCVSKMEEIHLSAYEMQAQNIQVIPIAYKSDIQNIKVFFDKHKMSFTPYEIVNKSAMDIQLLSVPTTYVFDKNGVLIDNKFNIREEPEDFLEDMNQVY